MLCLSGFELYSQWEPLTNYDQNNRYFINAATFLPHLTFGCPIESIINPILNKLMLIIMIIFIYTRNLFIFTWSS